jgi:two-component system, NtrC family, sensor kinase
MQNGLIDDHPSTELLILETLVDETYNQGTQQTIPIKTLEKLKEYVKASEVTLLLFDQENPAWVDKKLLGDRQTWKSEMTFFSESSILCKSMPKETTLVKYDARSELDRVIFDDGMLPIENVIIAPLQADKNSLGAILLVNTSFDMDEKSQGSFLQLVIKGLASAIQSGQQKTQLIIQRADAETTYWQILNSRNTLRTFFDNLPSSVYIVDRSYTIIAINSSRSERVKRKPQDLVGQKCYAVLYGNSGPCTDCRVMDTLNGIPSVRTFRELGPNETFIHWDISTVPIRENPDTIDKVIIFEEDVTDKWILEANLIQAEKMASIGQLAANVAHEINNPLAAIIANAQLLIRDLQDADENTMDSLKLIETAGDRAAKIVSNLLESARREKHFEFEEISLNETILDAISLLRYEINQRSVSINLDLEKGIPHTFANKNQLKGVWINLINNALGAIESNPGRIGISTRYENKAFTIVFSDNGKGIAPENQEHIFEPFFTTKEAGKGTGLGLSVSLQAIKEHHGDIQFETTPGVGTRFIVVLPDIDGNSY